MINPKYLVIHCSNTSIYEWVDQYSLSNYNIEYKKNTKNHCQASIRLKSNSLNYHDLILLNGKLNNISTYTDNNLWDIENCKHLCLIGGLDRYGNKGFHYNLSQLKSLIKKIKIEIIKYSDIKIIGHNEYSNKRCPNFDVSRFLINHGFSKRYLK